MKYYIICDEEEYTYITATISSLHGIESEKSICKATDIAKIPIGNRTLILSTTLHDAIHFFGSKEQVVNRIDYGMIADKLTPMLINEEGAIIYKATAPSGKVYIGQTRRNFFERMLRHYYAAIVKRHDFKFCRALRKHRDQMRWEVLERCSSPELLNEAEIRWIAHYHSYEESGYNSTIGGSGEKPRGDAIKRRKQMRKYAIRGWNRGVPGQKWSEEQKHWISSINKGRKPTENMIRALRQRNASGWQKDPEIRRRISESLKDHPAYKTEEFRQKMSEVTAGELNGMYGKNHSEETKQKMSESKKKVWQDPTALERLKKSRSKWEIIGPDGTIYINDRDAAAKTGLGRQKIKSLCQKEGSGWIKRSTK